MHKLLSSLAAVSAAVVLSTAVPAQAGGPYNLTLCAASVGGTWSVVGGGVDQALRKSFPGSTISIQTSGGGIANAKSLVDKKCDLGIMHAAEVSLALKGAEPFPAPVSNLRVVARLENWSPMHFLLTKEFADKYNIKSIGDIAKAKAPIRVVINKRGNMASAVAESLFNESGFTLADIESWGGKVLYGASAEQSNLIRDRRADGGLNVLYPRFSSILETAQAVPVTLVDTAPDAAERVAAKWNVDKFVIEGGTYAFQPNDTLTVTMGAHLITLAETPDELVRDLAAAIYGNIDEVRSVHPEMGRLTPELLSSANLPYHPAAAKFYAEKGVPPKEAR